MIESGLIARAVVDGDRDAFGELVKRHQSAVRNFLRHLTRGDAARADDLAQETFLHAWRGLARFRGEALFLTWLLGIAHNQWRNNQRRQRDHEPLAHSGADEIAAAPQAELRDLQNDLALALAHLSTDEQLALHLAYQQGLSHSEIAAVSGWPLGTVKTQLARGKEKLRPLLSAWNRRPKFIRKPGRSH